MRVFVIQFVLKNNISMGDAHYMFCCERKHIHTASITCICNCTYKQWGVHMSKHNLCTHAYTYGVNVCGFASHETHGWFDATYIGFNASHSNSCVCIFKHCTFITNNAATPSHNFMMVFKHVWNVRFEPRTHFSPKHCLHCKGPGGVK